MNTLRATKTTKYRNKKTVVNGIKFDSQKESGRYKELLLLQRAGQIRNLKLQPTFTLQEAWKDAETGEPVRAIKYVADFEYQRQTDGAWETVVEDVKGRKTKDYLIKRKMMLARGIRVTET